MSDPSRLHSNEEKIIKIKPIEVIEIPYQSEDAIDRQKQATDNDLQQAYMELQNISEQKASLLKETRTEIEQERAKWKSEKQSYMDQAKEAGYNAGYSMGKDESLKQYQNLIAKANSLVKAVEKDYHATIEQADDHILDLSIFIAEKILKQKISAEPESFITLVSAALKEIKNQPVISIYLHPANYEFVLNQKNELINILEKKAELSLYVDDEATKGYCLIEHPFGQIDASIDTQLGEIRNLLQELVMENKE